MGNFLFALAVFFTAGVFSLICMVISLAVMIRLTENSITKPKKIILIVLPALSVILGFISSFGLFGTGAAVVISVVMLIISVFIWIALFVSKKR